MASRYWVSGGNGIFSSTTNWSTTDGGSSGASSPGTSDTAYFTGNSGSGTATLGGNTNIGSLITTGFTGTIALGSNNLILYGSTWTLASSTTITGTGYLENTASCTFTQNSATMTGVPIRSAGGTLTLGGAINVGYITLIGGSINTQGYTIACTGFGISGGSTITVNLNSSTINITGSGQVLNLSAGVSSGSFSAIGSTINVTVTGASYFNIGFFTLNNLYVTTGSAITFYQGGTFNGVWSITPTAPAIVCQFVSSTTWTISSASNFQINGANSTNYITINSSNAGTPFTISCSSGIVSCDYLHIKDSTATGGASFYAGSHSTNVSGNTGWIFSKPPNAGSLMLMGIGS